MIESATNTILKVAGSLPNFFNSMRAGSTVEFTSAARIEPVCVMESSLVTAPYISSIMHTANTLIGLYFMQAFAIDNQVGDINIIKRLDKLNPNRSVIGGLINQPYISAEDYSTALPTYHSSRTVSEEAYDDDKGHKGVAKAEFGKDLAANLRAAENLAVGKILEITVQQGKESATIPVTVSLMPLLMDSGLMVQTFAEPNSFKNTRKGRLYRWKAGELETIRDMIFCRDLIDGHRSALVKDNTGFYAAVRDKRKKNKLAALASGDPSIGTISNVAIMSTDTARSMELELGGKLSDYKTRQRVFNDTSLMILFVVDQEREMVTIYYHGIDKSSIRPIRDLENATKKSSSGDLTEILRAFQQVSAPAY